MTFITKLQTNHAIWQKLRQSHNERLRADKENKMGNRWEVVVWIEDHAIWKYQTVWKGQSPFRAILEFYKARKISKCIKLVWRPK